MGYGEPFEYENIVIILTHQIMKQLQDHRNNWDDMPNLQLPLLEPNHMLTSVDCDSVAVLNLTITEIDTYKCCL